MSRRLNFGLIALVALLALAVVFAISRHAALPDPASCVGRVVEDARNGGPTPGKPAPNCRPARSTS